MRAGDPECLAQPPWPGAEQALVLEAAPTLHLRKPVCRLERADQDCVRDTLRPADKVDAPVNAVGAVDVRMARRAEHGRVAAGAAAVAVGGRVLVVVGLDLDDLAADSVDQECGTDQLGRDLVDVPVEELGTDQFGAFES